MKAHKMRYSINEIRFCNETSSSPFYKFCIYTDFLGNSLRRGTPSDCCHTDSNASTTNSIQPVPQGGPGGVQTATGNSGDGGGGGGVGGGGGDSGGSHSSNSGQVTQVPFGEDDSSCDSHTRWGKKIKSKKKASWFLVGEDDDDEDDDMRESASVDLIYSVFIL